MASPTAIRSTRGATHTPRPVQTTPEPPVRALYDVKEAARYLSVSPAQIHRWRASGDLVGIKISPRLRRWTKTELDSFAARLAAECAED